MRQQFVSPSDAFPDELRETITAGPVLISGRPLQHYGGDGEATYFQHCGVVKEALCVVHTALIKTLGRVGHNHIDPDYFGVYPVLMAESVETGDEFVFGAKPELDFVIQAAVGSGHAGHS